MHGSYQIQLWCGCKVLSCGGVGICGWEGDIGQVKEGIRWMKCGWCVSRVDTWSRPSIHTFFFWKFEFEHFSCFYFCSLCTRDSSSLIVQTCVMPKDCQTSDWSLWSPCSKTCRSTDLSPGYRLRSRMVTQIPIGGGKQCPILEEKEACNIIGDLLSNCPRYSPQWRSSHFQAHRPRDKVCECLIWWEDVYA